MNKPQIKNFSVWARRKLIETVSYRMSLIGITEKGIADALPQSTADLKFYDIGTGKPAEVKGKDIAYRSELVSKIGQDGYKNTVEEIAYTWFNRLIAIRFMEVNNYLPSRVRVLSSLESGKSEPDIVTEAISVAEENGFKISADEIYRLKDENKADELFGKMFEFECRQLNSCLPELFGKSANYMEMLLPVSYTDKDGIIYHLVHDIPEDDFNLEKEGQVEIIGWLYQYYNTEPKDTVFANLKKNIKISKENIPAATQLFTPDWIVRYMVENSLGRLWLDGHSDCSAKSEWKYYLEEAEQEESVKAQLEEIRRERSELNPEQIKFIDPCMGSGHILIYAFDVLMQIYSSCGYSERDAARLIIQKNLYGLDIDRRAYQLAYFALMMKARQYDRRFLTREDKVKPNLAHFQGLESVCDATVGGALKELAEQFRNCDTYGSLTEMNEVKGLDEALDDFSGVIGMELDKTERMMTIYKLLSQKYDVVCTNPPYMGNYPTKIMDYAIDKYPESKYDLYALFLSHYINKLNKNGLISFVTGDSWLFTGSFEQMRKKIVSSNQILNLIQLGSNAFEAGFGTTAFVIKKYNLKDYQSTFVDLTNINFDDVDASTYIDNTDIKYILKSLDFFSIEDCRIAFKLPHRCFEIIHNNIRVGDYAKAKAGIVSGNDKFFIKYWYEIANDEIVNKASVPYGKYHFMKNGGGNNQYYGNYYYVFMLSALYDDRYFNKSIRRGDSDYYFKKCITWSKVGNQYRRFTTCENAVCGTASPAIFVVDDNYYDYILAFLNSKIAKTIIDALNPTINLQSTDVAELPLIVENSKKNDVDIKAKNNIEICKTDWDSFETSWDFKKHPLIPKQNQNDVIHFCAKLGAEKWIKKLREGEVFFNTVQYYIDEAVRKGNDEQGDKYEGVFAKLKKNNPKIKEMQDKLGNDLEIIEDDDNSNYVYLRRVSCKSIIIFCLYGIYDDDLVWNDEPQLASDGQYHTKVSFTINEKMYENFLSDDTPPEDVWGFFGSVGHLMTAIDKSLESEEFDYEKTIVKYDIFESDEFFIETNETYNELYHKRKKFAYQNEARYILFKTHRTEGYPLKYEALSSHSANIGNGKKDFVINAIVQKNPSIQLSDEYNKWDKECSTRFEQLKHNEEELNRIFIDIYGLQDELTPEVEDKDVTVRKADLQRDIKSLVSYAVGCMFGRYSLNVEGLAYAGGEWDDSKYSTYIPDKDNCIPITDDYYFEDDIVKRFADFISAVYGEETLEKNLDFIADALGNKGKTSREVIRNYFLNDFYKDHLKIYQKRPIYWLFDSGKQNGFKALIYMHRWNADTIGNVRVEYLHKTQKIYMNELDRMQDTIDNSSDSREIAAATKAKEKLTKQLKETKDYDASMAHLANMRIDIDLDDGVKVNYEKVQTDSEGKNLGILAKI